MSNTIHISRESGFTLVELLIVVIILAILAAIVVPQFSATTDDAKQSAYASNLASLRAVAELYKNQHGGDYPGKVAAGAATCAKGTNQEALVGTPSFPVQLTNYTNADSEACTGFDADEFKYGPYLKDGIPANPLGTSNTVTVVSTGILGLTSLGTGGWRFDSITGELIGDH